MECPEDCKTKHEQHKEELGKLGETNKEQWKSITERPKSRTLISFMGIGYIIIALVVGSGYAISDEKIESIKNDQKDQKKEQQRQYESIDKKTDDIKESMYEMSAMMREMKALIKERKSGN